MKLRYKSGLIFLMLGLFTLAIIIVVFYQINNEVLMTKEIRKLSAVANEVSLHMQSNIIEKIKITKTISSFPLIEEVLVKDNLKYSLLDKAARKDIIEASNDKWMNMDNINDPFIQKYITNSIAKYFNKQIKIFPLEYGEIFLTNKFGVVVASTSKLTTLAHSQKYWWEASYNNGKVFIDDRGYDKSSNSVVLGIVVPVLRNEEVLGILKCNVNIMGSLTDVIRNVSDYNTGKIMVVRSHGAILVSQNIKSLSETVNANIIEKLSSGIKGFILNDDDENFIIAYTPIKITLGSNDISFGGSFSSIDQEFGNSDESWFVLVSETKGEAERDSYMIINLIIFFGVLFIFLMILVALIFGRMITNPINTLLLATERIGLGDLETKVDINTNDEIGVLGTSINNMASNLMNTMATKKELENLNDKLYISEKSLKKANEKLYEQVMMDGLTTIQNRRSFDIKIHEEWNRLKRTNEKLSLIILDIDFFKKYNDTYGHQEGDDCLKNIAIVVDKILKRTGDFFARYGGEEFVALIPFSSITGVKSIANNICKSVEELYIEHSSSTINKYVTVSCGVATMFPQECDGNERLLIKMADDALYKAKKSGRNRIFVARE